MNILGYLRCSTEEQARSGLGLEAQRTAILQECKRREWEVTWIVDDGYTGSNVNRPGLTTALASLRNGTADTLVVAKLDRLSRSLVDFSTLMARARKEKWRLVALDLNIDMTSPSGELMANVMASFADFERKLISARTKDALQALKDRGVVLGRPRLVAPSTAERIGQWRRSGCSHQAIAQALNDQGVPTAHGGRQWWASTVRGVLASHARQVA